MLQFDKVSPLGDTNLSQYFTLAVRPAMCWLPEHDATMSQSAGEMRRSDGPQLFGPE